MYCCSVCVRIQVLIDTSERACCFARFFCFVLLRFAMFCHFTFALPFFGVLPCSFLLFLFVVSPLPYFCFWLCVPPPRSVGYGHQLDRQVRRGPQERMPREQNVVRLALVCWFEDPVCWLEGSVCWLEWSVCWLEGSVGWNGQFVG